MQRTASRREDAVIHTAWFSDRECELLNLVQQGRQNKEMATTTGLKVTTVRGYLSDMMSGLGLSNRTELCAFGIRHPQAAVSGAAEIYQPECLCPVCSAVALDKAA
jgi:DNA-binding NarL/FixJ family response regulator